MDAISAIGQRIAQIQSMVADPASAVAGGGIGGASSSGTAFEAALAEALSAGTGTTSGDGNSGCSVLDALGLTGSSGPGSTASSALDTLGLSGTGTTSSLLAALGLTGSSGLGLPSTASGADGGLDANGVPAALAGYGNGHIPAAALAPVGSTGVRMWQPAAQALTSLIAAARADGVTIGVTEGYRSYDEQVSLAKTKGLYSQGGLAAEPGTSEHGWGMAADLGLDATAQAWMQANASRFGFVADTPREAWHWAYHPSVA
jgi:hypothetical protein